MVTATKGKHYCIWRDMNEKKLTALEILGENFKTDINTTHLSDGGKIPQPLHHCSEGLKLVCGRRIGLYFISVYNDAEKRGLVPLVYNPFRQPLVCTAGTCSILEAIIKELPFYKVIRSAQHKQKVT